MDTQIVESDLRATSFAPNAEISKPLERFVGPTECCLGEIIGQILAMNDLARDDNFWDLGLDSMQAISVIVQIEKKLGFKATVAMLLEAPTVRALADAIDRPKVTEPAGVVAMLAGESKLPPLFLVHMSGGDLTCYAKLTADLGAARSVYGIIPPADVQQSASLETLAKSHVKSIKSVQPRGPYYLAGFCFGGLLAYEIAQQLTAAGDKVAMLGVIDYPFDLSGSPRKFRWDPVSLWKFAKNLGSWARDLATMERSSRSKLISQKLEWARMRMRHRFNPEAPLPGEQIDPCPEGLSPELWDAHERAWRKYQAKPYPGKVTVMRLKSLPIFQPYDSTHGWGHLASEVEVRLIPGPSHGDVLRPPYVQDFAKLLNLELQ